MKTEYHFLSIGEGNFPPLLIVLIYRPPDVKIKSDPNLTRLLRLTCSEFSNTIDVGDLNADMLSHNNSGTKYIRDLMDEISLKLVSTGPTHRFSS